ncbi:MAG: hypothetical protein IIX03_02295, partial [Paludibacteraceae bacterium]|nr:hypothetical protein [Paludibacteraceae bacterium]
ENFTDYLKNDGYLGAAIGRYSNRLKDSVFTLNGTEFKVGTMFFPMLCVLLHVHIPDCQFYPQLQILHHDQSLSIGVCQHSRS